MANFPVFQGGQLTHGVALRNQAQIEQQRLAREKAFELVQNHNTRLSEFDEKARQVLEMTQQLAATGAGDEQIKPLRTLYTTIIANRAVLERNFKIAAAQGGADPGTVENLPSGVEGVQNRMPFFDAAVDIGRGQIQDEQVETLTPEQTSELGFPDGSIVQKKPDGTLSLAFSPSEDQSSLQERIDALVQSGVDPEKAKGIAAGRFQISLNPITSERRVMDLATGELIGEPETPAPGGEVSPMLPEDIEAKAATGGPGFLKNVVNVLKGAVNAGPAFPDAQEATASLTTLQTMTGIHLQAEVPGRPSNFLLQELGKLTVTPNSIFQGEAQAKTRLEQTKRLIDGEVERIEVDVLPLELPPDVRVNTQLNLTQLKRLSEAYDGVLKSFDEAGPSEAPEDLPDEVKSLWSSMTPEERKLFTEASDESDD